MDSLKIAAKAANLTPDQQQQIDALSAAVGTHKKLSNLPQSVAQQEYQKLTPPQKETIKTVVPERGFFGDVWHYATLPVTGAFKALTEVSDFMTRAYRTGAIMVDQSKNLVDAWNTANDRGDKVFSPDRINKAKQHFGNDMIDLAMRVQAGEKLSSIIADDKANENVRSMAAQFAKPSNSNDAKDWENALAAVDAAKYSPGRQLANLILPGSMEGQGIIYRAVSGVTDAAYRIFADPTLVAGKVKKAVDISKYALEVVVGNAAKVDEVFARPAVQNFWNTYGNALTSFRDAKDPLARVAAEEQLRRIAPEFGLSVIKQFNELDVPISNAMTAKAYFQNAKSVEEIMKGQAGRSRPLMPRLDAARKTRIAVATTANKVFNLDIMGPKLVNDFYGQPLTDDGVAEAFINGRKEIIDNVTARHNPKLTARFSMAQIAYRVDRAKAKLDLMPVFKDGTMDVTDAAAATQIYRVARLVLPKKDSQLLASAFNATEDVGKRKELWYGLWDTVSDIRGINMTEEGKTLKGLIRTKPKYAADIEQANGTRYNPSIVTRPDGTEESIGLIASDFNNFVSAPSIRDIDRLSSRSGLLNKMFGVGQKKWVENLTSYWSFLTLAGPRYALRNATEDLMVHLATGQSVWGVIKGRSLSTRWRLMQEKGLGKTAIGRLSDDPVGVINRLVHSKERDTLAAEIKNAPDIKAAREVVAKAFVGSKIQKVLLSDEDRSILADMVRHGNIDNMLADITEGAKNSFNGLDFSSKAKAFSERWGRTGEYKIVLPKKVKAKGGYGQFEPIADDESKIAWMYRIGYYLNDQIGSIAVKNLKNRNKAVQDMVDWIKENPSFAKDARLTAVGLTPEEHAGRIFDAAEQLFLKKDRTLNEDFWNKVVNGKELNINDLPTQIADVPQYIVGPKLVPVSETENFTGSLMQRGWDWLGESNNRFSREPMVYEAALTIRKEMNKAGFSDRYIAAHTKGLTGDALTKAENFARRNLNEIVMERAAARVLQYVDNPAVQTQLSWSIRNFARFYRATEDFYRRVGRATKYNPEAWTRVALTYEGISHSGWLQKDDQGDTYFIYPGLTPVYKAMQQALRVFGVGDSFKIPMPVQFGAKLNMLTPSMNPDSLFPTFAGPVAALPITAVSNIVRIFDPGSADTIQRVTLGKYAEGQSMLSALLPAHVNRFYAALNRDEKDSQYASAFRKAVTYLEASGHGLSTRMDKNGNPIPPTPGEVDDYQAKVKAATISILALRATFGFFAPASPQTQLKTDMQDWVRSNGEASFKSTWNDLLSKSNGNYDKAMEQWVKYFPKEIPYTVTESQRKTVAFFTSAEKAGKFVENNKELFAKYPQGAAFFIPNGTDFSYDAYQTMKSMGLRENKTVSSFLKEIQTAADLQTYYSMKNDYDAQIANAPDSLKKILRDEWSIKSQEFKGTRPLIGEELALGGERQAKRMTALGDLQAALTGPDKDKFKKAAPETFNALSKMVSIYDDYKSSSASFGNKFGDVLKMSAISELKNIGSTNAGTQYAYDFLFARLIGE